MAEDPARQRQLLKYLLRHSGGVNPDELLFDPVTGLPGLPLFVRQVEDALVGRKSVGILTVNIARFSKLEDVYGWELFDDIVRGVADCLKEIRAESLRKEDTLAELTVNGNVFVFMLSPARSTRIFTSASGRRRTNGLPTTTSRSSRRASSLTLTMRNATSCWAASISTRPASSASAPSTPESGARP